jgi:hypothetical protein
MGAWRLPPKGHASRWDRNTWLSKPVMVARRLRKQRGSRGFWMVNRQYGRFGLPGPVTDADPRKGRIADNTFNTAVQTATSRKDYEDVRGVFGNNTVGRNLAIKLHQIH